MARLDIDKIYNKITVSMVNDETLAMVKPVEYDLVSIKTRLHKSRSSRSELEFDLSNFV